METGLQIVKKEKDGDSEATDSTDISDDPNFDDLDFDDDCEGEDDPSEETDVHPVLLKDIELLKKCLQRRAVSVRDFSASAMNELDVDMDIPTYILGEEVCKAWGLIHKEPITVRLIIDAKIYLDTDRFLKVEVFQKSLRKKKGIYEQLRHIVEKFCKDQLKELSNAKVELEHSKMVPDQTEADKNKNCKLKESFYNDALTSDQDVAVLLDMGFEMSDITRASQATDGTKESITDFLVSELLSPTASKLSPSPSATNHLNILYIRDPNQTPSLSMGFLVQLYIYINQRLPTLNDFCPLCDTRHNVTSMLKPVVCTDPLCLFACQTLGVMADVSESIATQPQVVNLLLNLTKAAILSPRCDIILNPFPCVVDPLRGDQIALSDKHKDMDLLRTVVNKFHTVKPLYGLGEEELRTKLDQEHVLCYPLLRWLISSNRCYMVTLPPSKRLNFMETRHQFLLRNSTPAQEKRFMELKKKHGSVFAFHGSPIENWHSIIRQGLVVASGTDKQLNGACHGQGIYLSPQLEYSLCYMSGVPHATAKSSGSVRGEIIKGRRARPVTKEDSETELIQGMVSQLECLALCEVIKESYSLKKHDRIWVCRDSDFICTRFLFVYDEKNRPPPNSCRVDVSRSNVCTKQIEQALSLD